MAYVAGVFFFICAFLYVRRKRRRKKFTRALSEHYTTVTFKDGGDPIEDRIEFHFINRRKD